MKTVTLNNGVEMPLMGFGVYQITDADLIEGLDLRTGERLSFAMLISRGGCEPQVKGLRSST